jgi:hypothetical protein
MVKLVWLPSLDAFPETTEFKSSEAPAGRIWGRIRSWAKTPSRKPAHLRSQIPKSCPDPPFSFILYYFL